MLWNFPDKLKREMFLIVLAACPENLAEKENLKLVVNFFKEPC